MRSRREHGVARIGPDGLLRCFRPSRQRSRAERSRVRRFLAPEAPIGHSRAMAEPDVRASNAPEITVSELANALKRAIEDRFGYVRVRGEISGYRGPHSSGHAYFSLKDAFAW